MLIELHQQVHISQIGDFSECRSSLPLLSREIECIVINYHMVPKTLTNFKEVQVWHEEKSLLVQTR